METKGLLKFSKLTCIAPEELLTIRQQHSSAFAVAYQHGAE